MKPGVMLEKLETVETHLPAFLNSLEEWKSLDVDYEPPRVERLWMQITTNLRVYLHRIHPCETALFHPHPWPSAVRVLSGRYEMDVGHRNDGRDVRPGVAARLLLTAGAAYEMIDEDSWHSVRPLGEPSLSLMITETPYTRPRNHPGKDKTLHSLSNDQAMDLLRAFQALLGVK